MHMFRHYNISANSNVEFPLSLCGKICECLMHVVARQPFSATVSAKRDEVERPRVKEPVQTEWPPRKVSLHGKSCIAKSVLLVERVFFVATGLWPVTRLLFIIRKRPAGRWLQQLQFHSIRRSYSVTCSSCAPITSTVPSVLRSRASAM